MTVNEKIFDSHVHVYPDAIADRARVALGKFYNFDVPGKGTYQGYLEECRENKTTGFLLFSVATTAHQVGSINDYIASRVMAAREEGFEAVGFAAMHQEYDDVEKELDRAISLGLCGIKIHPDIQRFDLLDPRMFRICEAAEGRLIINFHMGDDREEYRYSEPKKLAALLRRFPKLKVIASHLGGYKAWDEAAAYLYGNPMVWYDNSSALWAMTPETARKITLACGTDRVMFGTDFPVMKIGQYLELFNREGFGESEREAILYGNAKRLFQL
ncbi:MAG: amidohydrolase [Clostridia bacterium]|nr:amidohydrolase [Clostridia bacterium]